MSRKRKNFCNVNLMLIMACLANIASSCDKMEFDSSTIINQAKFTLDGISFHQMQLSSANALIGISGGGQLIILPANEGSNNLTNKINAKGTVISTHLLVNDVLLALLIPLEHQNSLQLVKASLIGGEIFEEINIALRPKMLIFDNLKNKEIDKTVNLVFNTQYLDAQIIPFENGYTAIVIRKNVIPTVIWVKGNDVPIEQPLLPNPVNEYEAQLKMSMGRFRAWKKGNALMIALENDPSYKLVIKSYFPKNCEDFRPYSHIIFESTPSGLALSEGRALGSDAKLVDNGKGNIFSASVEQNELIIRSNNDFEFRTTIKGLQPKTSINGFYVNESGIWLVGETGIVQVSTGSIVAGSQAFLVKVLFIDGTASLKIWNSGRRNCVSNIFVSQGKKYITLIENAPLTHDTDQTSTLNLLEVKDF